jgi:sugar lactone lactonase YvrE
VRVTTLVCVQLAGAAARVAVELLFPNGCLVTSDGRTLIVADTWAARVTEFTNDAWS